MRCPRIVVLLLLVGLPLLAGCATEPIDPALRHVQEADAAMAEGRPEAAARACELALEDSPGDLRALRRLLAARVAAADPKGALSALARLEAADPEPVDPCPALALAPGETPARRAVAEGCPGAAHRLARALTLASEGRAPDAALALLREAIDLDPGDPGRFELASRILIEADRVEDGIALLARGLERHPEDRALSELMVRALSIR